MEKPTLIYLKSAENTTNKLRLPHDIVKQWGRQFYMEVYEDKIILKPVKKGE